MSVIIKGMKLPKNCMECDLHFIARGLDNECIFFNDTVDDCTERRLYRCPLVEIPTPHGRLIDAEKLAVKIWTEGHFVNGNDCEIAVDFIQSAPTIIEAEVSE